MMLDDWSYKFHRRVALKTPSSSLSQILEIGFPCSLQPVLDPVQNLPSNRLPKSVPAEKMVPASQLHMVGAGVLGDHTGALDDLL